MNHINPTTGQPMTCDLQIIGECIRVWFGSVAKFDDFVQTGPDGHRCKYAAHAARGCSILLLVGDFFCRHRLAKSGCLCGFLLRCRSCCSFQEEPGDVWLSLPMDLGRRAPCVLVGDPHICGQLVYAWRLGPCGTSPYGSKKAVSSTSCIQPKLQSSYGSFLFGFRLGCESKV